MKILVIVAGYPDLQGGKASSFVHTRNMYYAQRGITPVVLNFRATEDYEIDGIQVIRLSTYVQKYQSVKFDILASHASNLREHYRFLKRYEKKFPHIVFFFHGHEVLRINECYPKPYSYKRSGSVQGTFLQDLYDGLKFKLWRKYYQKIAPKACFVFVSEWLRNRFYFYLRLCPEDILRRDYVIHNSVGEIFEKQYYALQPDAKYDFIILRSNLDGAKYGLDIAMRLANCNQKMKFLVVGKGDFFIYNSKPFNVDWIEQVFNHQEIPAVLNCARCALMPTRQDTQGLMTCEMATFGIPVITSDIPVCHEIVSSFGNVRLINNEETDMDITPLLEEMCRGVPYPRNEKYYAKNTLQKEIELFSSLLKEELK